MSKILIVNGKQRPFKEMQNILEKFNIDQDNIVEYETEKQGQNQITIITTQSFYGFKRGFSNGR